MNNIKVQNMRKNFKNFLDNATQIVKIPIAGSGAFAKKYEDDGVEAIAVTGAAVNFEYGKPDNGFADYYTLVTQAKEVLGATDIPVVCDVGTGHGIEINVARTVRNYEANGAAGIYLDDGVWPKKYDEMDVTMVAPFEEVSMRIKTALATRKDNNFLIMLHSSARDVFDLDRTIELYKKYVGLGIDGLYVDKVSSISDLEKIGKDLSSTRLLINIDSLKGAIKPEQLHNIGYSAVLLSNDAM